MTGGTRYGLKLAQMFKVPIYNYGVMGDAEIRRLIRENHEVEIW
jgi:hypothetical protein